ncbi:MAG: hypothetical protein A2X08_05655 [Bacteroidetes bacterium GWA2_32_17]|nr:MAG: hypothetical protein A2X08_05655 [Bacteroidetes bacterium GWA2_32_17]
MKTYLICFIVLTLNYNNIIAQCAPNAGLDDTTCGQTYTLQGSISQSGSTVLWTSLNGAVFSDSSQLVTNVFIPAYTGGSISVNFILTETNTSIPCTASDTVTITFIRFPHAEAGISQSVCGTTTQLYADTIGSGITNAYWTSSVPGININYTGSDPLPWNPIVDASGLGSGFWINSQRQVWFYWHGQGEYSCTSIDSLSVTFYEIPIANAGLDTFICGKIYNLNASPSIINYTGIWTASSGPGSSNFNYATSPNGTVTVTQFGVYFFYWKEMNFNNTTCFDRDTVIINFKVVPMPDAGLDFGVCGKFAHICVIPSVPGGQWSCPQGGVPYYDAPIDSVSHYNPSYQDSACAWIRYGSENDTVTMYWFEFNGVCAGFDSVNVYFGSIEPAIELVDPVDTFVCGPIYHLLNAQQPAYGSGFWYDTVANTMFSPSQNSNNNLTATIDTGGTNNYGWHHFYWVTVNGQCRDTSTVVPVKFIRMPVSNAGTDTSVCNLYAVFNANWDSIATGTWYFLQGDYPSAIANVNSPLTFVAVSQPGIYHYIWQLNTDGVCFDSDTVQITFNYPTIIGIAQSSLVSDFSDFKAEVFPEINYNNNPFYSSSLSSNGNFSIWALPNQNYYLKISAINPQLYQTLANTYYDSTYNWQDATILTTTNNCDTININIPLVAYTPATGGQCRIYGLLRYDGSLAPVQNAMVYLRYQPNQDLARFEYTNQNGYYSINNIANGNYKLFVDIPGLPQITNHHIIVNPNDTVFADVNFIVDTTSISKDYGFGIYADTTGFINVPLNNTENLQISVFPNPFNQQLTLSGNLSKTENISAEIFDNLGKPVFNCPEKQYVNNEIKLTFPTSKLISGIYYLKVTVGNNVYIKKIAKQ